VAQPTTIGLQGHLTFKGNLKHSRYGWLRLTPAYSVHLVSELLDRHARGDAVVLDPFCGTGTTALACAERGIECHTTDINPFLLWLAEAKTRPYTPAELATALIAAQHVERAILAPGMKDAWVPPLHQIEKWWDPGTLAGLARAFVALSEVERRESRPVADLLKVAFCRTTIGLAHVSFGHQSMSFKAKQPGALFELVETPADLVAANWRDACRGITETARTPIRALPSMLLCDARNLTDTLSKQAYDCVITSPPYPNRMSYIRELRPYMYWLGYLSDGRAAGELDWQAIGGTWGSATSSVGKWVPDEERKIPYSGFDEILSDIAEHSVVLSRYIHKYFYDMVRHCDELHQVMKADGTLHYIIGNSKFYDTLLPVQEIYASMFERSGFADIQIQTIRKRTSKKELYEFVVSARKPMT
jgi:DNA modification methylase